MFLLAFVVMGRASDVTEYCPLVQDIIFPTAKDDYAPDGRPLFLSIPWTNWKSRRRCHRNKKYPLLIHANLRDPRFCPVNTLLTHLWRTKRTKGPLFAFSLSKPDVFMKAPQFAAMVARIFTTAAVGRRKHLEHCTPHSIRKSGAQVCSNAF